MNITVTSTHIEVVTPLNAWRLKGSDIWKVGAELRTPTNGGVATPRWNLVLYLTGDAAVAVGSGELAIDLQSVVSPATWNNGETGAKLAFTQAYVMVRSCCGGGTPGAVIAVNAANCQNLFDPTWGLTEAQLTDCVIPGIDFCDDTYKDALTPEQLACICDIDLCELLGEVTAENVVTEVFDCLTEEAQEALLAAECEVTPCDPVTIQLRDTAANNIGAPDVYTAGTTTTKTAPDGTVNVQNLNGTTLGSPTVRSNAIANYAAPIPLKFGLAADEDTSLTWTVTDDEAGTYGTYTQDGASGTLTYSKNGAAFSALTGSIVLAVGNTIAVKRTTFSAAGFIKWAP
jgi:hypothetical protein